MSSSSSLSSSSSRMPRIPPELLYKIVLFVAVDYLDDLIAGPYGMPQVGGLWLGNGEARDMMDTVHADQWRAQLKKEEAYDPALRTPNPLHLFFSTSFQLRSIALKALSHLLGIGMTTSPSGLPRLAQNPWTTRIHPVRLTYLNSSILAICLPKVARLSAEATRASPLLRAYQVVGRADVVLTAPQTYGIETMRWARTRLARVREDLVSMDKDLQQRRSQYNNEDEDWTWRVASRIERVDQRSYAISVFTLSICLLRSNLCSIRRAVEFLSIEGSADPMAATDPFTVSLARTYQENVALLLSDIQEFDKFRKLFYTPPAPKSATNESQEQNQIVRMPAFVLSDDIRAACAVFDEIVSLHAHPAGETRYAECREAAREVRESLTHCLDDAHVE